MGSRWERGERGASTAAPAASARTARAQPPTWLPAGRVAGGRGSDVQGAADHGAARYGCKAPNTITTTTTPPPPPQGGLASSGSTVSCTLIPLVTRSSTIRQRWPGRNAPSIAFLVP